jgi:signal transduction histidine kinase
VLALVVARLAFVTDFRPPQELWIDLLVVLVALGAGVLVGVLVRVGVGMTSLQSPNTFAIFSAVVTLAFAVPAGVRVRRALLARRYGSGTLSPSDVADITADLHSRTEPRDLLDKAARMVAAASGSPQVRIVLGADTEIVPAHWSEHPLVVGTDRVGTLLVESVHHEGPERRQERVVEQLLPTVALVARAVGLAVEAEHARRDVARERDAERARILADLHDGLGPVLAGMSMRVRAGMRTASGPYAELLGDLEADLATSRTDLRRIVGGITPSVLDDGDLEGAMSRLVQSFQGVGGPKVSLDVELSAPVPAPMQVTVYRCVAEGITNALRHAQPHSIDVRLCSDAERLHVEVLDDGTAGSIVPGVGLTSLTHRAESLGGSLTVKPGEAGTRLHLELPLQQRTAP